MVKFSRYLFVFILAPSVLQAHDSKLHDEIPTNNFVRPPYKEIILPDGQQRPCGTDPMNRAYVISRDASDLTIIDLDCLEIVGTVDPKTVAAHMVEIDPEANQLLITSTGTNEVVVVDTAKQEVVERLPTGEEPTHASLEPVNRQLAVMLEGENAVSFVDARSFKETARLQGFQTPHFMRFTRDGKRGFVANINGNTVTEVDMKTFAKGKEITFSEGQQSVFTREAEGGFADVQIDRSGQLFAAHRESGRVLVYDTNHRKVVSQLGQVGVKPWVVFAEHPFSNVPLRHIVPAFESRSMALIEGRMPKVRAQLAGDEESYGVNYSSQNPDRAFVMQRRLNQISVVNTRNGQIEKILPVGGYTETASTSADGRYVVATVSGANRVVIIDAKSAEVVKTFENVGNFPWSVTIPYGQNYCH